MLLNALLFPLQTSHIKSFSLPAKAFSFHFIVPHLWLNLCEVVTEDDFLHRHYYMDYLTVRPTLELIISDKFSACKYIITAFSIFVTGLEGSILSYPVDI